MKNKTIHKTIHLSRRGFLVGGSAALATAGLGISSSLLSGCKKNTVKTKYNGVITAAVAYTASVCKPIANTSALFCAAGWHVFESLYEYDFSDYSLNDGLAVGYPTQITETQYQVNLREGAKFSNGQAVVANDVVNAFKQNIKDDLFGANLECIKSMVAVDDSTLLINLNHPFHDLLRSRLALIKVFPANSTEEELKTKPIGSGPWMYTSIDGNDGGKIEFAPNPYYNGLCPAEAEKMVWEVLLDDTSRTTAITDQSDKVIENVPVTNVDLIKQSGAEVEFKDSLSLVSFVFNCLKTPFDDKRVRQAMYYAIDMDKLINNQLAGYANPASCLVQTSHPNYHKASNVYEYNPEKAKSLLAEAGVNNLTFTLSVNNNWVKNLSSQIKNDLSKIGVTANLEIAPITWSKLNESNEILPFDVLLTPSDPSCFGDDADLTLSFLYGDNSWMRGRSCYKKAKDSRWQEIYDMMLLARQSDARERQELWNKCYDIISEECPIYPLLHRQVPTGYIPDYLENFKPISTTGLYLIGCKAKTEP